MHVTLEKCNCRGIAEAFVQDGGKIKLGAVCAYKRCFLQFQALVAAGTVVYCSQRRVLCSALGQDSRDRTGDKR